MAQNAEMSFNFGAQPFKHPPTGGFIAVCQTAKDQVKNSEISGGASTSVKQVNYAPQAIIIEVGYSLYTLMYYKFLE